MAIWSSFYDLPKKEWLMPWMRTVKIWFEECRSQRSAKSLSYVYVFCTFSSLFSRLHSVCVRSFVRQNILPSSEKKVLVVDCIFFLDLFSVIVIVLSLLLPFHCLCTAVLYVTQFEPRRFFVFNFLVFSCAKPYPKTNNHFWIENSISFFLPPEWIFYRTKIDW